MYTLINIIGPVILGAILLYFDFRYFGKKEPYGLDVFGTPSKVSSSLPQLIFNTNYLIPVVALCVFLVGLICLLLLIYFVFKQKQIIRGFFLILLILFINMVLVTINKAGEAWSDASEVNGMLQAANYKDMSVQYKLRNEPEQTETGYRYRYFLSFVLNEDFDKVYSYYLIRFPASSSGVHLGSDGVSKEVGLGPPGITIGLDSNKAGLTTVTVENH